MIFRIYGGAGVRAGRSAARVFALFCTFILYCGLDASACSVPVFRYALERWDPAPYELIVFHRGKLDDAQQALVTALSTNAFSTGGRRMNLKVLAVDLDAQPDPAMAAMAQELKDTPLPALVLRAPKGSAAEGAIWTAPLSDASVREVLDSPVRQRVAERLVKGDSAVWLLLESGDKSQDDAAAQLIETRIAELQKTLKLPEIEPDDIVKHQISGSTADLKIAFSFLRVSRHDPAEQVLVRTLLSSEDDLDDTVEPLAFPVFGRGRALFALVGKGINRETVDEACSFVTGPCSCVVKDLNPGQDLLLAASWGSVARTTADDDATGLGNLAAKPGTRVPIASGVVPSGRIAPAPADARGRAQIKRIAVVTLGFALLAGVAVALIRKRR